MYSYRQARQHHTKGVQDMITKVYVRISGQEKLYDVRYASNAIREYVNEIPNTVKAFIEHTAYTTKTVMEYGKSIDYIIFEA